MNIVKGLLLGAAGLVAAGGAQAADMPVKAKPVQYVKICSLYGDGFYYIPGTDTCLKMGGYLRTQAEYNTGSGAIASGNGGTMSAQARFARDVTNDVNYRTRAVISWDVRQQTEYGVLRSFIRTGIQVTTPGDTEAGNVYWDRAFMQFAGFTVGKTLSFFDLFNYCSYAYHDSRVTGDTCVSNGLTVWGYTAEFGNGCSGTVSLESPHGHIRQPVVDASTSGFFAVNGTIVGDTAFSQQAAGINGWRMPDIIFNLRVDQPWGFAGVSAAIHEASGAYYGFPNSVNNGHPADKLGWAVQTGGQLNLPGGDIVGINVCYAQGAPAFCTRQGVAQLYNASTSVAVGWIADGVFAPGTEVELTRAWSVQAAYQHIWNRTLEDVVGRRLRQRRLQRQCHGDSQLGARGRVGMRPTVRRAGRKPLGGQGGRGQQLQSRLRLLGNRQPHAVESGAAARYRVRAVLFASPHRLQGRSVVHGQSVAAGGAPHR